MKKGYSLEQMMLKQLVILMEKKWVITKHKKLKL